MLISKWIYLLPKTVVHAEDAYLSNILYPHWFNRHPKNLSMFNQWEASQMRTFFLYGSLPLLVHLRDSFPSEIVTHFSLLFIYIRTLIFFYSRSHVIAMRPFTESYLEQLSTIYGECAELLSTHVLVHLWKQCLQHGALAFHSMFTIETSLHHLGKMAHGTVSLGEQISFWYSIDRHLDSKKVRRTPNIFLQNYLFDDKFFDQSIAHKYNQRFMDSFSHFFGHTDDGDIRLSDRFRSGICVFHSIAYKLRKRTVNFRVCIYNSSSSKLVCFGEIVFFFRYHNENFLFFKQTSCSSLFSKYLTLNHRVQSWSDRIDKYFYCVNSSSVFFHICPCSSLLRKCIFLPFDGDNILCTNVDHELEHD